MVMFSLIVLNLAANHIVEYLLLASSSLMCYTQEPITTVCKTPYNQNINQNNAAFTQPITDIISYFQICEKGHKGTLSQFDEYRYKMYWSFNPQWQQPLVILREVNVIS